MLKIKLPGTSNGFVFNASSSIKNVELELRNVLFPYVTETNNFDHSDIYIELNSQYIELGLSGRKKKKIPFSEKQDAYRIIMNIIRNNLHLEENFSFLHGASLAINQKGCLFIGESTAGKSTLCAFFDCYDNVVCLSDDLIIIDTEQLNIYPIARYVHLRSPLLDVLSNQLSPTLPPFNNLIERFEYPVSQTRFNARAKAEYIFVLHRGYSKTRISLKKNGYDSLIENMYLPYQIKNNIKSAIRLQSIVPIYDLYYDDMVSCLNTISEFLSD